MSDHLAELRESARQVVDGLGLSAGEDKTWSLISELGWLLTTVPEQLDGLGLGIEALCQLQSELGRGLSPAALLPAVMTLEAVCDSDIAAKASWIERLGGGEYVACSLAGSSLSQSDAEAGTISGLVSAVHAADRANLLLAWTSDENCVALLSLQQAGVELLERATWDATRRLFDIRFSNVELDENLVLARGDNAAVLVAKLCALRDFAIAADSLGGADALLSLTVEHLKMRQQFGRPLALFQALKHRCADLKTQLAGAEALMQASLAKAGNQTADDGTCLAAKKAKFLACSVFAGVAEEALQLHGGIGMASEHPCHLFLKRAMLNEHLGSAEGGYEVQIADLEAGTWQ